MSGKSSLHTKKPPMGAQASISGLSKHPTSMGKHKAMDTSARESHMNITALSDKPLSVKGAGSIRTLIRLANSRY
jgi:hypothetical protein